MPNSCRCCGAALDRARLVCAYCGTSFSDAISASDEVRALRELQQGAASIASQRDSMMSVIQGNSREQRLIDYWSHAFSPATPAGRLLFGDLLVGQFASVSRSAHTRALNNFIQDRLEELARTMRTDPSAQPAEIQRMEDLLDSLRTRKRAAFRRKLKIAGVVAAAFVSSAFVVPCVTNSIGKRMFSATGVSEVAEIGEKRRSDRELAESCRGEGGVAKCDARCQKMACSELCEKGKKWACEDGGSSSQTEKVNAASSESGTTPKDTASSQPSPVVEPNPLEKMLSFQEAIIRLVEDNKSDPEKAKKEVADWIESNKSEIQSTMLRIQAYSSELADDREQVQKVMGSYQKKAVALQERQQALEAAVPGIGEFINTTMQTATLGFSL